jgi:uncharacterized membrane protein
MKDNKLRTAMMWLMTVAMLLIVAGTLIPLLTQLRSGDWFKYVYAAGAVLLLIARIFTPYKGDNLRVKRLYRIESWSAIFFCVAAFFLFYDTTSLRDWLAFTLAGGCIQTYASIMIPRALAKDDKKR